MAHPYREPPRVEPARGGGGPLALPTVLFGLCCAIAGHALGGPGCALGFTIAAVVLMLAGPAQIGD